MDNREFFILKGRRKKGPYSFEEFKLQKLSDDDLIWVEGLNNWTKYSELTELKESLRKVTPPAMPQPLPRKEEEKRQRDKPFKILSIVVFWGAVIYFQPFWIVFPTENYYTLIEDKKARSTIQIFSIKIYNHYSFEIEKIPKTTQHYYAPKDYGPFPLRLEMKDGFVILFDCDFDYKITDPENFSDSYLVKGGKFPESFNNTASFSIKAICDQISLVTQYSLLEDETKKYKTSDMIYFNQEEFANDIKDRFNKMSFRKIFIEDITVYNVRVLDF